MFTIEECVMCGCTDVPSQPLTISVNIKGIVEVKVNGAKCTNCGEEYYDSDDIEAIRQMKEAYKEQAVGA